MLSSKIVVALAAIGLLISGCSSNSGAGNVKEQGTRSEFPAFKVKSSMANIQQRGKLRVGMVYDTPPFDYSNSTTGSLQGFDVDLARHVATNIFGPKIEGKIDWIPLDARDRENALVQNTVDIVVGRYEVSLSRKTFVDFAGPYWRNNQSIIVRNEEGSQAITNVVALNGQKVCIVRGSTNEAALKDLAPVVDTSIVMNSVNECGVKLNDRSVAAIAADAVDETKYLGLAGSSVLILKADYGATYYGIGLKKGDNEFRGFLNSTIEGWQEWESMVDRWSPGVPGGVSRPSVDRY